MRARTTLLLWAAALALVGAIVMPDGRLATDETTRWAASVDPPASLHIFYTPPGIVRAGSPVRVPADAVCSTTEGNRCGAAVTFATQVGNGPWQTSTRTARSGLEFDATPAAADAVQQHTGSVRFFLRAQTETGIVASAGSAQSPLRFWILPHIPKVAMPRIPFGRVRKPATALFLPWGSGPNKAGLSPGRESSTLGPSSFDVDEDGRIHLLDTEQDRLAVFADARLIREVRMALGAEADVAVAADGTAYVLDATKGVAEVRRISPSGAIASSVRVGEALSAHITASDTTAYANLLPADMWVAVPREPGALPAALQPEEFMGRPFSDRAQLVRFGTETGIRLAEVSAEGISNPVEVTSELKLGEVALAEPDGAGGYWCVVRVWRDDSSPGDHYQVLHVKGDAIVDTFAVGAEQFADVPPLSRFRLGADGDLYQLSTSPSGVRILQFDLGGEA